MIAKASKVFDRDFLRLIPISLIEGGDGIHEEAVSNVLFSSFAPLASELIVHGAKNECHTRKMQVSVLDLVKKHPLRNTTAQNLKSYDRTTLYQQLFAKPKPRKTSLLNFSFFASAPKEDVPCLDETENADLFSLASKRIVWL